MPKNLVPEESRRFLSDVCPENCFWVNNGPILKNLSELLSTLKSISDETFRHHANPQKNDFAKWIDEVIGDKKLAKDIAKSRNKKSLIKKVDFRVKQLTRAVG